VRGEWGLERARHLRGPDAEKNRTTFVLLVGGGECFRKAVRWSCPISLVVLVCLLACFLLMYL
jgi:hypothetical protein